MVIITQFIYVSWHPRLRFLIFPFSVFFNNPKQPSIIGGNVMTGYEVLFDTVDSGRIGFAISDCNYTRIVQSGSKQGNTSNGAVNSPAVAPTKSPSRSSGSITSTSWTGSSATLALSVLSIYVFCNY